MHQTELHPREGKGGRDILTILDVERGNETGHGDVYTVTGKRQA